MQNIVVDVKKFAELLGIDYIAASGLMKVLKARGIAKQMDMPKEKKKGKPSVFYEIPTEFTITIEVKDQNGQSN